MIKCNLSVLLAERGLKMIDIVRDTGLSQNAVRGLYYNSSKGIQFETLEIICDYLKVEPGDILKKIDFQFKILGKKVDHEYGSVKYEIQFIFNQKNYTGSIEVCLADAELQELYENDHSAQEIILDIKYNDELQKNVFSQITGLEIDKIEQTLTGDFVKTLGLEDYIVGGVLFVIT